MELPISAGHALTELILETQPHQSNSNGKVYMKILASIGLDSPTSSQDTRGNAPREGQEVQQVNTPIRNSTSSLMALGKHVFTPMQGRIWEHRSKSPLGS